MKGPLYSCLLIPHLPSGSRMINIWKPAIGPFFRSENEGRYQLIVHTSLVPGPPSQRFCVNIKLYEQQTCEGLRTGLISLPIPHIYVHTHSTCIRSKFSFFFFKTECFLNICEVPLFQGNILLLLGLCYYHNHQSTKRGFIVQTCDTHLRWHHLYTIVLADPVQIFPS